MQARSLDPRGSSPRVRGTRSWDAARCGAIGGSSPRVRGTGFAFESPYAASAVHPRACGEQHGWSGSAPSPPAVHPRACGEQHRQHDVNVLAMLGSSPRVRGTVSTHRVCQSMRRFIPARAGNSALHSDGRAAPTRFIPARAGNSLGGGVVLPPECGSSPRVRGTGSTLAYDGASAIGSSPRVRGTASAIGCRRRQLLRFIPARAGNSVCFVPSDAMPRPVHPRACGEHGRRHSCRLIELSVHPRACGEHGLTAALETAPTRFIPARAGNSLRMQQRMRETAGSSPRVRGTDRLGSCRSGRSRFIPARAGNRTRGARLRNVIRTVHPRACGEQCTPAGTAARHRSVHPRACGEQADSHGLPCLSSVHPRACGEHGRAASDRTLRTAGSSPRVRGTR